MKHIAATFRPNFSLSSLARTCSMAAILAAAGHGVALAQVANSDEAATPAPVSAADIVVSGTRITRDGFSSPTPTTVLGIGDMNLTAPANIADAVNQLPALSTGFNPRVGNGSSSSGTGGLNTLNLRNLGLTRTLVLLDGRRVVGSTSAGLVNVNTFPQQLIERVDVVTGGASAAYGSDAVAGVVNFIMKKNFTGLKIDGLAGISKYGDGGQRRIDATFGTEFAGGRGHFVVSGSYSDSDMIDNANSRSWYKPYAMITNPNGTVPARVLVPNVYLSTAAPGGLIIADPSNGPLQGIQFGQGGTPRPFQFGQIVAGSPNAMIGGEPNSVGQTIALAAQIKDRNIYSRVGFDVTPDVSIFAEGQYGQSKSLARSIVNLKLGNLVIQRDNAFLPDSIRAQMVTAGITSLKFGTLNGDIGEFDIRNDYDTYRAVAGIDAKLGGGWSANAYYEYGRTDGVNSASNQTITARYNQAIDAIKDASGNIVCRNPANGCVPLNIIGTGVASPAGIAWSTGTSIRHSRIEQNVASLTIHGDPFSTWAGPVSVAFGGEYRTEKATESSDALSLSSSYFSGNFKPTNGSYNVKEGFLETVVPLAKDLPLLQSLELNGAVRATDYSTTGYVTTWKVGATWRPINDLLLRGVRSRDIRAPNIADLFAETSAVFSVTDPFNGGRSDQIFGFIASGNPNLKPEIASNLTLGAVYTPSFLPGFSISFDRYQIHMKDYITSIAANVQQMVNLCYAGTTVACGLVTRDATGHIATVRLAGVNAGKLTTSGYDIEASYRKDLSEISPGLGRLSLRLLVSHLDKLVVETALGSKDFAGEVSQANPLTPQYSFAYFPKTRGSFTTSYEHGPVTVGLVARYIGPAVNINTYVEGVDVDHNRVAPQTYFDASITFRIKDVPGAPEIYFAADNVFNKQPPAATYYNYLNGPGTAAGLYDTIGTYFRAGFRTKF